ncbi:Pimeloyl-ACP methyl ester carboxylesterase [Streptomyces sp. Ncost-T6T-1]|uniref:alpha/beta fold hydrolase n=1 Tax=Streptomyces sp. Ncost-T6T-1 TaxID=1100828 RepID=UPI0008052E3E|nr:alpha/beta hydrolase [Streptomyces sp. Ncost-T6T-1]SBU98598.1 Pimeloyl-ACP methyl ester carboxylesterase [Streptomyces sp. Ncost-T6T-1]
MSGSRVAVRRDRSARSGDPLRVLALHGLAASGTTWRAFGERVSAHAELWIAELPWGAGGESAWSHRGDPAEWIGAAMRAVPGGADVVIAHSFSAMLAVEHLAGAPRAGQPSALVLVSPFHRRDPADFHWDTAGHYLGIFQEVFEEALRISPGRVLAPGTRRDMAILVRDRVGPYGWLRFWESYLRSPFVDTSGLGLPVLVVAGENDRFAAPRDAALLAAALPQARLELLPDCGHFPMTEQPERFADTVRLLLDDCRAELSVTPKKAS